MKLRDKVTKLVALILSLVMVLSLAACGEKTTSTEVGKQTEASKATEADKQTETPKATEAPKETDAPQETVNIVWYRNAAQANEDEKLVEAAINEYIEPLIGVTVTVLNSKETTKLSLALAGGDEIDLFWTATGYYGLETYIKDGFAYDITDIVEQYPELYNSMPKEAWEYALINGRNYYVPIYKEMAAGTELTVPTALVDKYGWDLSTIKELKDIEPMLAECYADGVDYPYVVHTTYFNNVSKDEFAFLNNYAGVRRDGDTTKIVNIIETPEYAEFMDLMYAWNQAGYINQAEASETLSDAKVAPIRQQGENAFADWSLVPDSKANATARFGVECETVQICAPYVETTSEAGSTYMINAKTEKVDACMKFLQLLFTDQKLADLAAYGIEGRHYTRNDQGMVSLIPDTGYKYSGVWCVTNVMTPSIMVGEAENKKELYAKFNETVVPSCTLGFYFDDTNVSAETTAIAGVLSEYQVLMTRGFYDPAEQLPKFKDALKAAGIDKVIAEMQSQYDAWLASK